MPNSTFTPGVAVQVEIQQQQPEAVLASIMEAMASLSALPKEVAVEGEPLAVCGLEVTRAALFRLSRQGVGRATAPRQVRQARRVEQAALVGAGPRQPIQEQMHQPLAMAAAAADILQAAAAARKLLGGPTFRPAVREGLT